MSTASLAEPQLTVRAQRGLDAVEFVGQESTVLKLYDVWEKRIDAQDQSDLDKLEQMTRAGAFRGSVATPAGGPLAEAIALAGKRRS